MFKKYSKKNQFSNSEIVSTLQSNDGLENDVLEFLYHQINKPLQDFILSNNGSIADAQDIIQDAIIVFYEKVKKEEFKLHNNIFGYIYKTGKYMWYNKLRKNTISTNILYDNVLEIGVNEFDVELFNINEKTFVESLLQEMSVSCQTVLTQSIYEKISMEEIAKVNGYKNKQIARNKKYKCLQELKNIITNSSYYKSIIKELKYG